jgi:hypothetical protein
MDALFSDIVPRDDLGGSSKSGFQKRQERAALPQLFLLFDRPSRMLLGGALFLRAFTSGVHPEARWFCTRAVDFAESIHITQGMCAYEHAIFKLRPADEYNVRMSLARVGGCLNDHFTEFAGSSLKVFSVPPLCADTFADPGRIFTIDSPRSYLNACGVRGEEVDEFPCAPVSELVVGSDILAPVPANPIPAAVPLVDLTADPQSDAFDTLRGLYAVQTQGAVSHRYSVRGLIQYLKLGKNLKPSANMCDALAASAEILLGAVGQTLAARIQNRELHLPSLDLLRASRMRMDYLSIMFQRQLFLRGTALVYQLVDSSPQLGFDILAVILDKIFIPHAQSLNIVLRLGLDLNANFSSQICPLSSVGSGNSSCIVKTQNTAHIPLLYSGTDHSFQLFRNMFRGTCSDSGTEKGINDQPLDVVDRYSNTVNPNSAASYLFPNSVWMPGHLHIVYNALENSVKSSKLYDNFIDVLRVVQSFLNKPYLVRKFKATCFQDAPELGAAFKSQAVTHIDWKWEFLSKALDALLPKFLLLRARFNLAALQASDSGSILSDSTLVNTDKALKIEFFEHAAELYRVMGKIIERCAKELEVCDCHHAIWHSNLSRKRRLAEMKKQANVERCVWMGRRLPWFIVRGKSELLEEIRVCTSDSLQQLLADMPDDKRVHIADALESVRLALREELMAKTEFLNHVPYVAIGAFYCQQGGTIEECKPFLRSALDEFDGAYLMGREQRLHRVASRLFSKTSKVREQADAWLAAEADPLENFPHLYCALQEYALVPMVERRIEEVHARVKRIGRAAIGITLPYLCALLREPYNLGLATNNPDFVDYCERHWRSNVLLDQVLALRVTKVDLRNMTSLGKTRLIYQCCQSVEFRNTSNAKLAVALWSGLTTHTRCKAQNLSASATMCLAFLKSVMAPQLYFSMSVGLFNSCEAFGDNDILPAHDFVSIALAAIVHNTPNVAFDGDTMVLFRVLNNHPEARTLVPLHHLDNMASRITVTRCHVHCPDPDALKFIVTSRPNDLVSLDLRSLVANIGTVLQEVFQWQVHGKVTFPKLREVNASSLVLASDSAGGLLPSVVGVATGMLVAPQLVLPDNLMGLNSIVVRLSQQRAFVGEGEGLPFRSFAGAEWSSVELLQRLGAITTGYDDFGDCVLKLNPQAVTWSLAVALSSPIAIGRMHTDLRPLKKSKLEVMMGLCLAGWAPCAAGVDIYTGGVRWYRPNIAQPLSYFVCLSEAATLFHKGVKKIRHGATDGYYRCLLRLDSEALQAMLQFLETHHRPNNWFRDLLKEHPAALQDEDPVVVEPSYALPATPEQPLLALPWPDIAPTMGWNRSLVHIGEGSRRLKVYFDHFSHQSSIQRGWVDCWTHANCIRYVFVHGDKDRFLANMYQWQLDGEHEEIGDSKHNHLKHEPADADVELIRHSLVTAEF